jgi:hypothetical protein
VTGRPRWSKRSYGERGVTAEKVAAPNHSPPPTPSWPSDVVVVAVVVVAPPSVEPEPSGLEDVVVVVVTETEPPSDPESHPDVPPSLPLEELL